MLLFLTKSIRTGTERYLSRKTRLGDTWLSFSPAQAPGSFSISPLTRTFKLHHHVIKPTWRFLFLTSTQTPIHTPPYFLDVNTVVHTHPKVSFRLKTHCNLMVRLDLDPMSPKDNRVKRQYGTTEITPEWDQLGPPDYSSTQTFFVFLTQAIFWIFEFLDFFLGVGGPTSPGLGVTYPRIVSIAP